MRKIIVLLLIALAVMVLASTSVGAQQMYPVVTQFAVQQSMDLGDPFSFSMLIAQEKTVNPQHMIVIVADPGQLVNLEHPLGVEGLITGELTIFAPEATWSEIVSDVPTGSTIVYVGANTLPSGWTHAATYWTVDVRENTITAIDVPNSVWEWPSVPLSTNEITCPADATCLATLWDGIVGSRAWHIVLGGGDSFQPPFPMEGSVFKVTGVAPTDISTLIARFNQMVEEVIIRDDPAPSDDTLNMTVFKLWGAATTAATGWTRLSEFDFALSIVSTGIGGTASASDGSRVRETPSLTGTISTSLEYGTGVVIIARDEQSPAWLLVRYVDSESQIAEGWMRSDVVTIQEGFELENIPLY